MDYVFETIRREIRQLTGEKIGKETVKNFYYGEGDPKFRIVMSIMRWVNSKEFSSSVNNNAELWVETAIFNLETSVIPLFKWDLLQYLLLVSFFT